MTGSAEDLKGKIEAGNAEAVARMVGAQPRLVDAVPLGKLVEAVLGRTVTHSGPPVEWPRMSGAQRGAVIAAALFEGWADSPEEAARLASEGGIELVTNHELGGVGPMAGVISPRMHVYVVEDAASGVRSYSSTEHDSFFGAFDEGAVEELRRWNQVVYPGLARAIRRLGGVELKPLMARALTMGDELHSRQTAASSLFASSVAAALVESCDGPIAASTLRELAANDLTFLPLAMAACKAASVAASGIEHSTVVTAMSRNGTEFGIQVSGLGDAWFTAPSPTIDGVYFPGYGPADAGRDIGDSAITETNGLGAFVAVAAPAITGLTGSSLQQLESYAAEMTAITEGVNPSWGIPQLGFASPPIGIDVRKVLQTGITPVVDTAIAHREPGHRIIGAGVTRAPLECFSSALDAWFRRYAPDC